MYDLVTWILIAAIAVIVTAIVVVSVVRGSRRSAVRGSLPPEQPDDGGPTDHQPDGSTLGDRSDILHRSRRGF